MSVMQVAGCALLSVFLILILREWHASLATPVRFAAALLLFSAAFALYSPVLSRIEALFCLGDGASYAGVVLRAVGIGLLCEFTACFCRDLGENTVAQGVLLFGKLEILLLSLPLVDDIATLAKELLQF